MGQSSKTVRILISASLIAMAALGAYVWFTFQVITTSENVAVLEGTIDARTLEEEQLRSAEHLLETTEAERAALDRLFVTEESVVSFIETIESLGNTANIVTTIASVEAEEGASGSNISSVRVRLAAVGSWRDVVHFVTLIDALPFVVDVLVASFERSGQEWQSTFTLRVGMIN
jgi:hypothetical protein